MCICSFKKTTRISALTLLVFALIYSPASLAEALLAPHAANYKVKISVLGGEMTSRLEIVDGIYFASSMVRPKGLARLIAHGEISERSQFAVVEGLVRPIEHNSFDSLSSDDRSVALRFDWASGYIVGTFNDQPFKTVLGEGVIDRASLQYALMADLLNNRLRAEYTLQDGEETKVLTVKRAGNAVVKVPYGEFEVVGVTHHADSSSRETTLWCAPALGYLPVVIEQYRDGKLKGRVVLSKYERID